jgi:hypothetical protein
MEHGEAFLFGRSDWQYVLNTFCFGYRAGYKFVQSAARVCNGNFLGIGADDRWTAVVVEQCAPFALLITNGGKESPSMVPTRPWWRCRRRTPAACGL